MEAFINIILRVSGRKWRQHARDFSNCFMTSIHVTPMITDVKLKC
jgi:hypothetical protein